MTHVTGPRTNFVAGLARRFTGEIRKSDCTITEVQEALHITETALLKAALRPLERFTCPSCPTESLTPEKIRTIGDAIAAVLGGEK